MTKPKIYIVRDGEYFFWCPGCNYPHKLDRRWSWNGSLDNPTFKPSLLVNPDGQDRCHLWVTDGKVIFLPDSYHALAGKTVELPDWTGF